MENSELNVAACNPMGWLRRVLIVDDEDFAEAQAEFLDNHNYEVRTAQGIEQAQRLVTEFYADVALINLHLGKENGIELIDKLKRQRPNIVCIMLTDHGCLESAVDALRRGACDYLHKPVDPKELLLVLERCFEGKRLAGEKQAAEQARREAEAANYAKTEFLSRMSHELRTPLNAILGFGQLLQLDDENLKEQQRSSVEQILAGGRHLLNLVNELLELTQIDSGAIRLSIEDVSTVDVVDVVMALVRPLAESKGVELWCVSPDAPAVHADTIRLKQVLVNLLSNAIKYNRRYGEVRVAIAEADAGRVRISVSDTGVGIKPDDQQTIFEPFQRVHVGDSYVEGAGIGLAISKRLIEAMAGRIGFESEPGKGSTFWFELPKAGATNMDVESEADVPDVEYDRGLLIDPGKRVLYVEDNRANLKLVEQAFEYLPGCELLTAVDAESGIEIARAEQPDLILMDIGLPGMDGCEALQVLRQDAKTKDIPVIAVSAHAMPEFVEQGRKAGFYDYLTKPINVDALLARIRKVFEDTA